MKTKDVLITAVWTLLLLGFCLFAPVYYRWHQESFDLSEGNAMMLLFIGMFYLGLGAAIGLGIFVVNKSRPPY